jgi:arabinogalactan oligomer / maltooligosaccharide transport system permease protein
MKTKLLLLSVLGILLIGGCAKDDRIHIRMWHQMRIEERLILERQLQRYMQEHPGVRIEQLYKETEQLRNDYIIATYARQGPEIVYGPSDMIGLLATLEVIQPLEVYFEKEYLDRFHEAATVWYHGHLYQLADKLGNHLALVYNKELLKEPPGTTDELIRVGKELTRDFTGNGRIDQYGLVWNYTEPFFYVPFLAGFGGWVMDENQERPTLDTPANVRALNFIQELRDEHRIIPREADYEIADALFKEGRAGMIINGDWSWGGYISAGIDIGVAPIPRVSETGLWASPMVSTKGFSVTENVRGEKLAIVLDLIRFLNEPANQLEMTAEVKTFPTRIETYEDPIVTDDEILINSKRQIDVGKPMPIVPELRAVWDAMRPNYQAVLNGQKRAETAARDMQSLAERKIRENARIIRNS